MKEGINFQMLGLKEILKLVLFKISSNLLVHKIVNYMQLKK